MITFHALLVTLIVLLIVLAAMTLAAITIRIKSKRKDSARQQFLDDLHSQFGRLGMPAERSTALQQIASAFRGPWCLLAAEEVSRLEPGAQAEIVRLLEAEGIIAQILQQAKSPLKWTRVHALSVLGKIRVQAAVPVLLSSLDDTDPDVRSVAVRGLSGMKLQETEEALIALLGRLEPSVSARIAAICIEMGTRTGPLLIHTLEDGNAQARFWAARILGEIKEVRATEPLGKALTDPEPDVRSAAAWALGSIGNRSNLKLLDDALDDPVWYVRAHAAEALGRLGDTTAAARLGEALRDRSWWVRRNALDALVHLGDAARPALLQALESGDRFANDCATEALTTLGVPIPTVPDSPTGA
jgi:HEAT repeat protein